VILLVPGLWFLKETEDICCWKSILIRGHMTEGHHNDTAVSEGEVTRHKAQCLLAVYYGQLTAVEVTIHTGTDPRLCAPYVSKYCPDHSV
jgi:hypothetical protein